MIYVVMLPTVMIFTIFTWYFLLLHFISLYLMVLFKPLCYFTHLVFHVTYWFYQFCLVCMVLSNLDTHYIVPTSFHWYIMVLTVLFHICHDVYWLYLVLHWTYLLYLEQHSTTWSKWLLHGSHWFTWYLTVIPGHW